MGYSLEAPQLYPHLPASMAQLDVPSDLRPGDRRFNPRRGRQYSFVEIYVLSRNKKNNVYPCKPQFYCIKVGQTKRTTAFTNVLAIFFAQKWALEFDF